MGIIAALRQGHLAILWVSQVFSAVGDQLYTIAVIWIAIRVAGGNGALVAAVQSASALLLGPIGGVYADRWDRRAIMIGADVARALAVLTLASIALLGSLQLWQLVAVAMVLGSLSTLFRPALRASLPMLAGDVRTLQATNGLMDATQRLARAVGPALAGLLVAIIPLGHFFTVDAVSFVISALAVLSLGRGFAWRAGGHCRGRPTGACAPSRALFSPLRGHRHWRLEYLVYRGSSLVSVA